MRSAAPRLAAGGVADLIASRIERRSGLSGAMGIVLWRGGWGGSRLIAVDNLRHRGTKERHGPDDGFHGNGRPNGRRRGGCWLFCAQCQSQASGRAWRRVADMVMGMRRACS